MKYHMTPQSSNIKTGPIAVSTSSRATCPSSCPFQKNGCYADFGPLNLHWDKITRGERGVEFEEFLKQVKKLNRHQLWRYGQAGDLPGDGDQIDKEKLLALAKANQKRPVIVFTHKPRTPENLDAIRSASKLGFPINLSANSLEEADKLSELNLPVVTVVNSEYERYNKANEWTETISEYRHRTKDLPKETKSGIKLVVCPATYTDTDCDKCRICSHDRKGAIVGFPAHGVKKGSVNKIIA